MCSPKTVEDSFHLSTGHLCLHVQYPRQCMHCELQESRKKREKNKDNISS